MENINYLGYRFRPSEDEIIRYFLRKKMRVDNFPAHAINDVDIRKFEPRELPGKSALPEDEEWYFFNEPAPKYANGTRTDRTTNAGQWKVIGNDRPILDNSGREVIGIKKNLVFHTGRATNGVKTSWTPFVLCRLKGNLDDKPENYSLGVSSRHAASR